MVKSNKGFTLAEVLIALVIIGIIAAITVPVIMQNHKKVEYASKLKKFYSTMNNALRLAETEQGMSAYEWDLSGTEKESFSKYFQNYISCKWGTLLATGDNGAYGYDQIIDPETDDKSSGDKLDTCFLNDGTFFSMYKDTGGLDNGIVFIFDLNGLKKPNSSGRDQFYFGIGGIGNGEEPIKNLLCNGFTPIGIDACMGTIDPSKYSSLSRDLTLKYFKNNSLYYVAAYLLFIDGWEFKDDYPLRL